MALLSPGVQVTVTDESFFVGAGPGTVPLIFVATKQDKATPDGAAIAEGTTAANANKLFLISSQRELLQTFGNPDFNEVGGSSQHGYPLNEYGLLAAYSYLGIANRAYVIRSDVDLAELDPTTVAPTGDPVDNLHWVDLSEFVAGIFEWSGTAWVQKTVTVYENTLNMDLDGQPEPSAGFVTGSIIASWGTTDVDTTEYTNQPTSLQFYRKDTAGDWQLLGAAGAVVDFQWAPHTSVPSTRSNNVAALVAGDIWLKTTTPNNGLNINVKRFDADLGQFVDLGTVPVKNTHGDYYAGVAANQVPAGTVVAFVDSSDVVATGAVPPKPQVGALADILLEIHNGNTTNTVTGTGIGFTLSNVAPTMTINGTVINFAQGDDVDDMIITINSNITLIAAQIVAGKTSAGALTLTAQTGVDIIITAAAATSVAVETGIPEGTYSNFETLDEVYDTVQSVTQPTAAPDYGTLWYDPSFTVDILRNNGSGAWVEYTDNVFIQSDDPTTTPSTAASVTAGDLWVETDQVASYPVIYRRNAGDTAWVLIDNTDQTTPDGIVFADVRANPAQGLTFDGDAPDPLLYPGGTLLFNTRYSGRNVKAWTQDATTFSGSDVDRWVSVSGLRTDGSPYMGVDAQKRVVVDALASTITSNEDVRNDTIFFNLIAAPGFIEVVDEMLALNVDRKEQAFVLGDAPFHLSSATTDLQNWASNAAGAPGNSDEGLVTANANLGVYYPSGLSTNVDGGEVVVPSSHMILRTLAYNDQVAYPWFAPAGFTRGTVTNASAVGYLNSEDDFVVATLNEGQRDTLQQNNVNPIATLPGRGLVVYGQKTRSAVESALDRVNVARLVNYVRFQADQLAQPFLFEPNDTTTRNAVKESFDSFLAELVTLRGLNDFLVVCDESNNTPARIDRSELWVDIAIQPIKAVEFIFIPIRLRNTGEDLSI